MPRRLALFVILPAIAAASASAAQDFPANPQSTVRPATPNGPAPQIDLDDPLAPALARPPAPPPPVASAASQRRIESPAQLKPLGLEQKAWLKPRDAMGPRQTAPGFLRINWRPDLVIQVNVRESMLTVIRFPQDEQIVSRDSSDPTTFETRIGPDRRSLVVRAIYAGVDGNIIAYGQSGNVYNIYVRSIPFNATQLPDTTVEIVVAGLSDTTGGTLQSTAPISAPYEDYRDLYKPAVTRQTAAFGKGAREWAHHPPVEPANMLANIDILVPDRQSQSIAPVRAWHDERFTYLDFGPNAASMNQWPVASLIIDGAESPVGARTTGPDGSLMIVEAIGDIVLRNGRNLVCLKLRNQADNRVPPNPSVPKASQPLDPPVNIKEAANAPRPAAAPTPSPEIAGAPVRFASAPMPGARPAGKPATGALLPAKTPTLPPASIEAGSAAKPAEVSRSPATARASAPAKPAAPAAKPGTASRIMIGAFDQATGAAVWQAIRASYPAALAGASFEWVDQTGAPTAPPAEGNAYARIAGIAGNWQPICAKLAAARFSCGPS